MRKKGGGIEKAEQGMRMTAYPFTALISSRDILSSLLYPCL
jgi:hypothetical protein